VHPPPRPSRPIRASLGLPAARALPVCALQSPAAASAETSARAPGTPEPPAGSAWAAVCADLRFFEPPPRLEAPLVTPTSGSASWARCVGGSGPGWHTRGPRWGRRVRCGNPPEILVARAPTDALASFLLATLTVRCRTVRVGLTRRSVNSRCFIRGRCNSRSLIRRRRSSRCFI